MRDAEGEKDRHRSYTAFDATHRGLLRRKGMHPGVSQKYGDQESAQSAKGGHIRSIGRDDGPSDSPSPISTPWQQSDSIGRKNGRFQVQIAYSQYISHEDANITYSSRGVLCRLLLFKMKVPIMTGLGSYNVTEVI